MPFKNNLIAKRLTILGSALVAGYQRAKIVGTIDNLHNPQFQFFTGSPDEGGPGLVWVSCIPSETPDRFIMIVASPESADGSQASLNLTANSTALNRTDASLNGDTINVIGGGGQNASLNIGNLGAITLSNTGSTIDIDTDGVLQLLFGGGGVADFSAGGLRMNANARRILAFDCGDGSDNTSGGNGTLNIPHNLGGGGTNFFVATRTGAANQIISRILAGDTNSTFQCRVQNNDGTSPANGTNISVEYIGLKVP